MNKLSFHLITSLFLSISAFGQNWQCGSDFAVQQALSEHPELAQEMNALETYTENFVPTGERVVRIVPIVFHVIHNYGIENISKEQIEDAVRIINEDFNLTNEDQSLVVPAFQGIVANVEFEFRLARVDPNGNCTDGITRTVSGLTFNADNNVKELISWPRNRYLNVWVVDNISFGAGGYAYLPGSAPSAQDDGIVVLHDQLGSVGTANGGNFAARTLTHEIGHFFNLRHPWGGSNSPGEPENCDIDDGVNDTPNTIGVANQGCNLQAATCGSLDNVQNFMDYSNCALMFTEGQKARMIAAITSSTANRNQLWSSSNLNATGVIGNPQVCSPVADFKANNNQSCANTDITFTDLSYNAEVDGTWNWSWSFPGGNPSSSNEQNPTIQYESPGIFPVSLTAGNSTGSNSKTKTDYIYIGANHPPLVAPLVEGIENENFPNNGYSDINWRVISSSSNAISRTTAASTTGEASMIYNNLLVPEGTITDIYSPVINLTYVGTPANLKFKLANARRSANSDDQLEVWISSNCGETWIRRYRKSGEDLATITGFSTAPWTPNSSQWREESVSVVPLAGQQTAMFRFTITDGGGNNIYIDDINIVDAPIGFNEVTLSQGSLEIFPNPSHGNATISYRLEKSEDISIRLSDVTGRVIGEINTGNQSKGDYTIQTNELATSNLLSGIYFITLATKDSTLVKKWIKN